MGYHHRDGIGSGRDRIGRVPVQLVREIHAERKREHGGTVSETNNADSNTMNIKMIIWKAKDGWRWHWKRSGRIVAESGEAYARPGSARKTMLGLVAAIKSGKWALACVAIAFTIGCTSFSTHVFRTEQLAVNLAHSSYVGWTNYLAQFPGKVDLSQSNEVRQARLKFAASVGTVEALRQAYETNSTVEPTLQAAVDSLLGQSSNIVWLITFIKAQH